jgi:hypothetical protein
MEFFIKKNVTLPVLKLQVVKDGRSDYNRMMDLIEESSIFFSMVDIETGIPKLVTRPAGFVNKVMLDPNAEPEYYVYYQFSNKDTNRVGRYEGQFLFITSEGNLILPIREKLYITVQDSFISDDLKYESCYVSEFPCCVPSNPVITTTTSGGTKEMYRGGGSSYLPWSGVVVVVWLCWWLWWCWCVGGGRLTQ